ncbi:MAG TPA: 50S ribosomal protein L21 [Candidatus Methanoperedens sp.]|nr:50S ribosomal protein L21 [Candidatus Methanoperedens sp.]
MKYAVIAISGTQYKVEENQTITVDKFDPSIKSTDQVLLTVNDDKISVGNPLVKGASVDFELVRDYQGEKLRVSTFKAKSRYRKTHGFRAQLSDIKITKINF